MTHINSNIKCLITKSYYHHGRLKNIEYWRKSRGIALGEPKKTRPPFGKASGLRNTPGSQQFYQIWGIGGRGFAHVGNGFIIAGVPGGADKIPCGVQ